MTNRIKTVQKPRVILVCCREAERLSAIISDNLNFCSFNSSIDDFTENTDFVIETGVCQETAKDDVIYDTAVFDSTSAISVQRLDSFRHKVTDYENVMKLYGENPDDITTYSVDNYGADIACRNVVNENGTTSFDIIGNGILSRISIVSGKYSVEEVLVCTAVLLSAGLPLAAVLEYFRYDEA